MELVEILGARVRREAKEPAKKDDANAGSNNEEDVPPDMDDDVPPDMGADTECTPPPVATASDTSPKVVEEEDNEEGEAQEDLSAAEALILQSVLQRNHFVYGEDSAFDAPNTEEGDDQSDDKVDVTAAAAAAQQKHDQQVRERMAISTGKESTTTGKATKKNQWGLPIAVKVIRTFVAVVKID